MYGSGRSVEIEALKDKVFTSIDSDSDEIIFRCADRTGYIMKHYQDCCESVDIESIDGDIDWLLNEPILVAEEVSEDRPPLREYEESYTWTFYKLGTIKGVVTIRWYGTSNGYYSEKVDLYEYLAGEVE